MKLEDTMKSISKKMRIDYEELSKQIKHPGMKGDSRENIMKEFLKKYLYGRFGITKGAIMATNGETSKQQDIIIYDLARCPILYNEADIQILPVEGVYVVIQVKSLLTDKELESSIKNISSVKKLPKMAFFIEKSVIKSFVSELGQRKNYFNTMGVLFAYSSTFSLVKLSKKIKSVYKKLKVPLEHQIDFIFILDKGLLVHYHKQNKQISVTTEYNNDLGYIESRNDGLLLYYLMLMERLCNIHVPPIKIKEYAKFLYRVKF